MLWKGSKHSIQNDNYGSGTGKSKLVKKIYNKEHSFKYKIEYPPTLQSFKQENYDPFVEENKLDLNNDKEINKFIMSEKSMDDNDDNNSEIKGVKDAFFCQPHPKIGLLLQEKL